MCEDEGFPGAVRGRGFYVSVVYFLAVVEVKEGHFR